MLPMLLLTFALGIAPSSTTVGNHETFTAPQTLQTVASFDVGATALRIGAPRPNILPRIILDPAPDPGALAQGDEGWAVVRLQERLRDLGVYRGESDGVFGRETAASVMALHKVLGVERTNEWTAEDWNLTEPLNHNEVLQRNPDEADRVEVDVARQVMFVIRQGEVAAVVPVSTGNGEKYWSKNGGTNGGYVRATTPSGDFTLFRHISGWRENYLGSLFKPWYFTPYYAIHGSRSVPAYPASHGCVRVPTWESNHLDDFLEIGLPVHIW